MGDRAGEGATLNNLGSLADDLGRKEEARDYYEQALVIFQEISAADFERVVRGNLAVLAKGQAAVAPAPPEWPLPQPDVAAIASVPKTRRWWPFGRRSEK